MAKVLQENQDRNDKESAAIEHMKETRNGLLETLERKQKLRIRGPEKVQASIFQEVRISDNETSEVEIELHEASDEMRALTMERRKAKAKGLRVSDTVGAGCWPRGGVQSPKL